eukprot:297603-Pleurochrysis_carterae.AAC.2
MHDFAPRTNQSRSTAVKSNRFPRKSLVYTPHPKISKSSACSLAQGCLVWDAEAFISWQPVLTLPLLPNRVYNLKPPPTVSNTSCAAASSHRLHSDTP